MLAYQIVSVLDSLINFYSWLVVIWCLLSWFPLPSEGIIADIAGAIDALVRPFISIFQRFIPPLGGVDFSPIVAFFALELVERVVIQLIYSIV